MTTYDKLTDTQQSLVDAALAAAATAYAPYSGFNVGAALLTTDDKVITGSNVENASSGLTICAERAALARANAEGYRSFRALAVLALNTDVPTPLCGACRQTLQEFAGQSAGDFEIILSSGNKKNVLLTTLAELLPHPFGPKDSKGA